MDISLDKIDKTEALIKVSVKESDYQPRVSLKIKDYSKKANIKGFRPGKVPEGLVKKMYGKGILLEELNSIVSESLNSYLRESEYQFLGEPMPKDDFETLDFDAQKDYVFEYHVGFAEDFDLTIDSKVKVDKHAIKIDDKVLKETIDNLRRQFGETTTPSESDDKDIVYGDIKSEDGSIDNEVSIDLDDVESGLVKKFIGLKENDEVTFDPKKLYKDSHKLHHQIKMSHDDFEALKTKATFKVKGITRQEPAAMDQELFNKTFGEGTVTDEAAYLEKVRESVGNSFKTEEEQYFDYQLKEHLIEKTKISLPDSFLKSWLLKTNDKITEEILQAEYEAYAKELKWSLIRNKLVKAQSFKVENEDVVEEAKNLIRQQFGNAGLMGQMDDKLDMFAQNYLQAENGDNYMKVHNQVLNQKVFDYLKANITIKEKSISIDEFRNL